MGLNHRKANSLIVRTSQLLLLVASALPVNYRARINMKCYNHISIFIALTLFRTTMIPHRSCWLSLLLLIFRELQSLQDSIERLIRSSMAGCLVDRVSYIWSSYLHIYHSCARICPRTAWGEETSGQRCQPGAFSRYWYVYPLSPNDNLIIIEKNGGNFVRGISIKSCWTT